jgi:hypothetical protein
MYNGVDYPPLEIQIADLATIHKTPFVTVHFGSNSLSEAM